jgi:AsmA protein
MKIVKLLASLVGVVIALILVAVIVIPMFVDPNDYREQISGLVKEHTGRDLTIEGEIKLSLFPWIGIELGKMELGSAKGFGPDAMARLDEVDVKIKLLPLLRKEVEMDTVVLRGLDLRLGRNAEGIFAWDDLISKEQKEKEPVEEEKKPGSPTEALAGLAIGGLEIEKAHILWNDQLAGQRAEISNLELTSGAVSFDSPFPIELDFDIDNSKPELNGHIHFATQVELNLNEQRYYFDDINLSTALASTLFPGGRLDSELSSEVVADLKQQTAAVRKLQLLTYGSRLDLESSASRILADPAASGHLSFAVKDAGKLAKALGKMLPEGFGAKSFEGVAMDVDYDVDLASQQLGLKNFTLSALGIALKGRLRGDKIVDAPAFSGHLESNAFVPRDVVAALGITLPESADPSTLTKANFATEVVAGLDSAALNNLRLQLDQSTLSGKASVKKFAQPVIRYDLVMDAIDADRYLPPPSKQDGKSAQPTVATPATAAAGGAAQLPLELLRSLDIDGTIRLGKLKIMNLHSSEMRATLNAINGVFKLHPLSAKLYQGGYEGNLRFDVRKDTPRIAVDEKLAGVQAGPLLKDFMGKDYVTGKANFSAKMTAQGLDDKAIRKTLNGNAAFSFEEGAVNGINVAEMLRNALAAFKKQPAGKKGPQKTDFAILKGSIVAKNGLLTNKDLMAKSPLLRVNGAGEANLVSEELDYLVKASVVGTLEGQGGKELSELKDLTVPIRVKGSFTKPKFNVELASLLEARAKAELEKKKKAVEEKARKRLDEEKQKLQKDLGNQLKDILKF